MFLLKLNTVFVLVYDQNEFRLDILPEEYICGPKEDWIELKVIQFLL